MAARRGWPNNGTNFITGDREIKELVALLDQDQIRRSSANKEINWHWNSPAAPHFGGIFEAMIKAAKRAISAILNDADVTDEELQTCFIIIGVESQLNSRPLTTVSDDPNDEPVLTANHFLIGQMDGDTAPCSVDDTALNPRNRWRRIQELVQRVWQRWLREYLPHLALTTSGFHNKRTSKKTIQRWLLIQTQVGKIGKLSELFVHIQGEMDCERRSHSEETSN